MEKFSNKFNVPLNESYIDQLKDATTSTLKKALIEKIGESIEDASKENVALFINEYLEDKNNRELTDLVENNSVFDFYLSYQNTIDDVLYKNKFFDLAPTQSKVSSLYDYTLLGTKKAIKMAMKSILNDIKKEGV